MPHSPLFHLLATGFEHFELILLHFLVSENIEKTLQDLRSQLMVIAFDLRLVALHIELVLLNGLIDVASLV